MNKIEMLEYVAKACRVNVHELMRASWLNGNDIYWNPLDCTGDAVFAALTNGIDIETHGAVNTPFPIVCATAKNGEIFHEIECENIPSEIEKAIRLAICRCAIDINRNDDGKRLERV